MFEFKAAWEWREAAGIFNENEAVRVFHGPGEGHKNFRNFAIDRFGEHYWITEWLEQSGREAKLQDPKPAYKMILSFLQAKGAQSIVGQRRPVHGVAPEPSVLFGVPPSDKFKVKEGKLQFLIQLEKTRHPGLFLDHAPLRQWLMTHVRGLRVLNTFAYTGSLSVAAGMGGAREVVTLDLSNSAMRWAKENWDLNLGNTSSDGIDHRWIAGDVFEWLPKLKRRKETFDCIILDPPSFSHGKEGRFSTAKDLVKLHEIALELLSENGILVTSINSANIPRKKFEMDVLAAAKLTKRHFVLLSQIDLPETFPTCLGQDGDRYLKGWILRSDGRGSSNFKASPDMG